jgi:Popeye protein conserved region
MKIDTMDLLAHFSNVLLLVSYSVRDILWLRWFAVAAAITVLPYYLARPEILWPPLIWGVVFMLINLYQIARVYAERRPVVLSPDEQALYDLGFQAMRPREFVSLALIGEWINAAPGDQPLTENAQVSSICIATQGSLRLSNEGKELAIVHPGHVIGTALALTGNRSTVTASFVGAGRYIRWPLSSLRVFLDKRPDLREIMQRLVSNDLAKKLEAMMAHV